MPVFGLTIGIAFLVLDAELVGGCWSLRWDGGLNMAAML